jgi:hypothetical protein
MLIYIGKVFWQKHLRYCTIPNCLGTFGLSNTNINNPICAVSPKVAKVSSGLYYKHVTIVKDASSGVNKWRYNLECHF